MNRKRILISGSIIAVVAAVVIGATGAFFSDDEVSTGNTFTAGAIDLKIDSETHYNGNVCTNVGSQEAPEYEWVGQSAYPVPGTSCTGTWPIRDLTTEKLFDFTDLKPGDSGENTISMHVYNNDAWACVEVTNATEGEGNPSKTEPEELIDPSGEGDTGELLSEMQFFAWADDGDNVFEPQEEDGYYEEPVQGTSVITDGIYTIADSQSGTPVTGSETRYVGVAWCYGVMSIGENGAISCDGSAVTNASQTDTASFDVRFVVEQARSNNSFLCNPPTTGTITIQKIVDGDPADFAPYFIDGDEQPLNTPIEVPAGLHTVSEAGDPDYNATFGDDCNANGEVDVVAGQSYTCTITNRIGSGTLTVNKSVVGGNATPDDFSFSVDGGAATPFEADGSNELVLAPGTYTITEPTVAADYTSDVSDCVDVVVSNGGSASCTITNTYEEPQPASLFSDNFNDGNYNGWTANCWQSGGSGSDSCSIPGYDVEVVGGGVAYSGNSLRMEDDAGVYRNISTAGYHDIQVKYCRRTSSASGGDRLRTGWKAGAASSSWASYTQLESVIGDSWSCVTFDLGASADNGSFTLAFFLDNGEGDYGLVDNVEVLGIPN